MATQRSVQFSRSAQQSCLSPFNCHHTASLHRRTSPRALVQSSSSRSGGGGGVMTMFSKKAPTDRRWTGHRFARLINTSKWRTLAVILQLCSVACSIRSSGNFTAQFHSTVSQHIYAICLSFVHIHTLGATNRDDSLSGNWQKPTAQHILSLRNSVQNA